MILPLNQYTTVTSVSVRVPEMGAHVSNASSMGMHAMQQERALTTHLNYRYSYLLRYAGLESWADLIPSPYSNSNPSEQLLFTSSGHRVEIHFPEN
jgi:hypothetical protein